MEHLSYLKKLDNEISNNEHYDLEKEKLEAYNLNNKITIKFLLFNMGMGLGFFLLFNNFSVFMISWFFLFLSNFIILNREVSISIAKLERYLVVGLCSLILSLFILIFSFALISSLEIFDYFTVNHVLFFSFCGVIVSSFVCFYDIIKYKKDKKLFKSKEGQDYEYSNKIDNKSIEEVDLMISIANVNELNWASDFLSDELDYLLKENGFNSYDEYFINTNNSNNELNIENY